MLAARHGDAVDRSLSPERPSTRFAVSFRVS